MEKFILTSVSLENSSQASLLFIVSLHSSLQAAPLFTHDKFQTENIAPMLKMFFSEPCKFVQVNVLPKCVFSVGVRSHSSWINLKIPKWLNPISKQFPQLIQINELDKEDSLLYLSETWRCQIYLLENVCAEIRLNSGREKSASLN